MPALHQKLELLPGSDQLSTLCPLVTSFIIPSILLLSKQKRWNLMGFCLQIKWSCSLSHVLESISSEKKSPSWTKLSASKMASASQPSLPSPSNLERESQREVVFSRNTLLFFMLRDLVKTHGLAKWSGRWGRLWKCTFCLFHELCIACTARLQNFVSHMK